MLYNLKPKTIVKNKKATTATTKNSTDSETQMTEKMNEDEF